MSDVEPLVSSALVPDPSGPEIKPRDLIDLIDLRINTTIKNAVLLQNDKAGLSVQLPDGTVFSIPQALRSNTVTSKHLAETNQPQQPPQPPVYKTKTGDSIQTGDYISITFIEDITLRGRESLKGAKQSYDREQNYIPVIPVRNFYKANGVLFGWVGIPNDSNSGFTFHYSTSSHNISIDIHDEKTIKIEKISQEEYHEKQAQMQAKDQAEEEIKARKAAIIQRYPSLKDKDAVLDFLIEYTPDTKTPKEICLLISQNPEIFKEYHGRGILPHRKANVDFSADIKKNESYECNKLNEPVRSKSAVAARNIASIFAPRNSGIRQVEIAPLNRAILNKGPLSKGGKKSKKRKIQKKEKHKKKKNTKIV